MLILISNRAHTLLVSFFCAVLLFDIEVKVSADCSCISYADGHLDSYYNENGDLAYEDYIYPPNYGVGCITHDENREPYCNNTNPLDNPQFCTDKWCYVDDSCDLLLIYLSSYFPESNLYYSYQVCGNNGTYKEWFKDVNHELEDLATLIEIYVSTIRTNLENDYIGINEISSTNSSSSSCNYEKSCNCDPCSYNSDWGGKNVSFATTIVKPKADISTDVTDVNSCISEVARSYFLKVVGAEYQDLTQIGYQYIGFQDDGTFAQWPAMQWCSSTYDPRFRPWYAAAITNPKVIILLIDVSGSMIEDSRINLAIDATKAVLNTLAWKDQVGFVLFNSAVSRTRPLTYVTDDVRDEINNWIDNNVIPGGGTSFREPLIEAIDMIDASPGCSNLILFLTDGAAEFNETDYIDIQSRAEVNNVTIFSYALGSGADSSVLHRIACENSGIFYSVPNDGDLGAIMSSYYAYYAASIHNTGVRWVNYYAAATATEQLAACVPLYDNTNNASEVSVIFGAMCIDINIVAAVDTLRQQVGWDDLYEYVEEISEMCITPFEDKTCLEIQSALEYVRNSEINLGAKNCSAYYTTLTQTCDDDNDDIENKDKDDNSIPINVITGILLGGGVFMIICIIIYFIYARSIVSKRLKIKPIQSAEEEEEKEKHSKEKVITMEKKKSIVVSKEKNNNKVDRIEMKVLPNLHVNENEEIPTLKEEDDKVGDLNLNKSNDYHNKRILNHSPSTGGIVGGGDVVGDNFIGRQEVGRNRACSAPTLMVDINIDAINNLPCIKSPTTPLSLYKGTVFKKKKKRVTFAPILKHEITNNSSFSEKDGRDIHPNKNNNHHQHVHYLPPIDISSPSSIGNNNNITNSSPQYQSIIDNHQPYNTLSSFDRPILPLDYQLQTSLTDVPRSPTNRIHTCKNEWALNFTKGKFLTTFASIREHRIPSSHAILFQYINSKDAILSRNSGLPAKEIYGGVPLTLRHPYAVTENDFEIFGEPSLLDQDDNVNDNVNSSSSMKRGKFPNEEVLVLKLPRSFLLPLPGYELDAGLCMVSSKMLNAFRPIFKFDNSNSNLHSLTTVLDFKPWELGLVLLPPQCIIRSFHIMEHYSSQEQDIKAAQDHYMHHEKIKDMKKNKNIYIASSFDDILTSSSLSPSMIEIISVNKISDFTETMNLVHKKSESLGFIPLFHYTTQESANMIIKTGLRMSSQGQGDGGVYLSTIGPPGYGLGLADYEENIIKDCFGVERIAEYKGKGKFDIVFVYGCDPCALEQTPGGRKNSKMFSKTAFENLSLGDENNNYFLRKDGLLAAFYIDSTSKNNNIPFTISDLDDLNKLKEKELIRNDILLKAALKQRESAARIVSFTLTLWHLADDEMEIKNNEEGNKESFGNEQTFSFSYEESLKGVIPTSLP